MAAGCPLRTIVPVMAVANSSRSEFASIAGAVYDGCIQIVVVLSVSQLAKRAIHRPLHLEIAPAERWNA